MKFVSYINDQEYEKDYDFCKNEELGAVETTVEYREDTRLVNKQN